MIYKYSQTIEIEINDEDIIIYEKHLNDGQISKEKYNRSNILTAIRCCSPNQWFFNGLNLSLARYIMYEVIPDYDNKIIQENLKDTSIKEEYVKQESSKNV